MASKPRIDSLIPGTAVNLRLDNAAQVEPALFLAIRGKGDGRTADFISVHPADDDGGPESYIWSAVRFKGRWAYGPHMGPLVLAEILSVPPREA